VEGLSLKTLASIYEAFCSFSHISPTANRQAVKVTATLLTAGTPTIIPGFAYNGPCYKFGVNHPRAARYWHQKDHGSKLPCGGFYPPHLGMTNNHSRSFHQNDIDDTKTEMALFTDIGKISNKYRPTILLRPQEGGPTEIFQFIITLSLDPAQTKDEDGVLSLNYHILSENIKNSYVDTSHGQFHIKRTISHHVPLQSMGWSDGNGKFHPLPIEWFVFAHLSIAASSMFSKILLDPHSEEYWMWEMLSFSTKWNLEPCHERDPQRSLN
jgi:hypothetical protein